MPEPRSGRQLTVQRYLFSAAARRVWAALLLLLAMFTLYVALSPKPPDQLNLGWDKANHTVTFASLAFVGVFALHGLTRAHTVLAVGLLLLGAAIEGLQTLVPGRSGDGLDLLADGIGIALGLTVGAVLARHFERRRRRRDAAAAATSSGR